VGDVWRYLGSRRRERAIADLRRALEVDPNSASTLMWLAFAEAGAGLGGEAKAHALLALRLSPRDIWIGNAQLALATASYCAREYLEAVIGPSWRSNRCLQRRSAAPS